MTVTIPRYDTLCLCRQQSLNDGFTVHERCIFVHWGDFCCCYEGWVECNIVRAKKFL